MWNKNKSIVLGVLAALLIGLGYQNCGSKLEMKESESLQNSEHKNMLEGLSPGTYTVELKDGTKIEIRNQK